MKMAHISIIFILVLALCMGIYSSSFNQFNVINNSVTVTTNTYVILNNQQQVSTVYNNLGVNYQTSAITTVISGTTTVITTSTLQPPPQCTAPSGDTAGSIYCALSNFGYNLQYQACLAVQGIPYLNQLCPLNSAINTVTNSPASNFISQQIGNALGVTYNSVTGNNPFSVLSNPLNQALITAGIFLSLGILAGLFGAGILARVMVLAGLALSAVFYIEGQLAIFNGPNGLPSYIWWGFNGIMTAIMLIIIWEAFDSGGVG